LISTTAAMQQPKPKTFDEFLMLFHEDVQERLLTIQHTILQAYPDAEESIRYNMPAFKINGKHVYINAYKKHIGLYPFYQGSDIEKDIAAYRGKNTKDALHFPYNKPLPLELLLQVVAYIVTH
jgi:uncharacterized protein YdhG (YjbR/CyaY superfamily)